MSPAGQIKQLPLSTALRDDSPQSIVTAVPVANIHAEPSKDAEVISQSIYGFELHCLDSHAEWIRICAEDAYAGWALKQQFAPCATTRAHPVRVHALSANIYREPDIKAHAPLLHLPWEARLQPLADTEQASDRWLKIRLLGGQSAFVLRGDVTSSEHLLTPEQMLALAHRFLGITYTWGGLSSFGFDCSGLMQTLHRQRGIVLPRDAQAQCDWSGFFDIPVAKLLPGDLLFFTESPPTVTHVGLSLGAERFLHSTTHGHPGVQISRLADEPWNSRLVAQRRLRA